MQNNLLEYYYMINFLKPQLLGMRDEFENLYANPIANGLCMDSTDRDKELSAKRCFLLHSKLSRFVLRRDGSWLLSMLPPKTDFIIYPTLSPLQRELLRKLEGYKERLCNYNIPGIYSKCINLLVHPHVFLQALTSRKPTGKTTEGDNEEEELENLADQLDPTLVREIEPYVHQAGEIGVIF